MSKAAPAIPIVVIMLVVLGAVSVGVVPAYPQLTGSFRIQAPEPRFQIIGAKLDRLTIAQMSSIKKDTVFLYTVSTEPGPKVSLSITLYYSGEKLAEGTWYEVESGLYSFSAVLNPRMEQQGISYELKLTATFPDGVIVTIQGMVPPS